MSLEDLSAVMPSLQKAVWVKDRAGRCMYAWFSLWHVAPGVLAEALTAWLASADCCPPEVHALILSKRGTVPTVSETRFVMPLTGAHKLLDALVAHWVNRELTKIPLVPVTCIGACRSSQILDITHGVALCLACAQDGARPCFAAQADIERFYDSMTA